MNNDLISREVLIKEFRGIARAQANARVFVAADAWEGAACKLETAPAVDAEPVRHGRWEDSDIKYAITELLEGEYPESLTCSICGFKHKFADEYGYSCIWHYCPNCGAKMDGGAENADS